MHAPYPPPCMAHLLNSLSHPPVKGRLDPEGTGNLQKGAWEAEVDQHLAQCSMAAMHQIASAGKARHHLAHARCGLPGSAITRSMAPLIGCGLSTAPLAGYDGHPPRVAALSSHTAVAQARREAASKRATLLGQVTAWEGLARKEGRCRTAALRDLGCSGARGEAGVWPGVRLSSM